jgi:hypothetical protein
MKMMIMQWKLYKNNNFMGFFMQKLTFGLKVDFWSNVDFFPIEYDIVFLNYL